ncbi:VOC family protein [Exiguobacterium flavidum]|uniref:VOC family protein n=1 Tax=Exiguobacterium flavidum TaxID=2184695 RepID=UPI000DF85E10|nr:VOC family protein [Exiguobacterium flavidum]
MKYGYTILYVEDADRTKHFYRDLLGLSIRAEHGSYVEFETGSTVLAFNTRAEAKGIVPYDLPEGPARQTLELGFVTDQVDGTYDRLIEDGVESVLAPTDKPWGQRVAYVLDPDGHLIELCSPM